MNESTAAVPIDDVDPAEVARWCKTFGVDEERLRHAIAAVGRMPGALEFYFRSNSTQVKQITDDVRAEYAEKRAARKRRSPKST